MAATLHRPLKVVAFDANGIGRQASELRKQMQDLKIDVALFRETHLKPHMRFYIPNYHIYRNDRLEKSKGGNAVAIPHTYVDLPPLLSLEATLVSIPIGHTEILLASVYKSPLREWSDTGITELLNLRKKSILASDQNAKHPVWDSKISNPSGLKLIDLLIVISKFRRHNIRPTSYRMGEVMFWTLWSIKMFSSQKSECWTLWIQITFLSCFAFWIILRLGKFWIRLKNSQPGSGFKASPLP
jgi:hypothetical protein